jgi:thiol:disulfide interchange protein DsbA
MAANGLLRYALLACGLLLTAACSAHNDSSATAANGVASTAAAAAATASAPAVTAHFTEGEEYVDLQLPAGQAAPTGPIEVVEVFSYGCPHCAHFAPYMDKLRAELPKDVEVRYMPAIFSEAWVPYARAFYAARQLGVLEQTHDEVFKAMLEHYPLNSLEDLANFYARQGVDRQKFLAAANNAETTRQMTADQNAEMQWGVDLTPMLIVGRRANADKDAPFIPLMRSAEIHSQEQLQQLGLWMVRRVEKH